MDRLFRIDFYPQDWLIDTARLTPEERGIFVQIVMMIYSNRGPIPSDEKHLANICNCSTRLVRAIVNQLVDKGFIQLSGGKISQKRTESELNKKRSHLESSSNGGRTKAENARQNKKTNDLAPSDPPNSLSSSTPTPSPIAKEKKMSNDISPASPRGGEVVSAPEMQMAVSAYNGMAKRKGLPVAMSISDARKAKLKNRISQLGGFAEWEKFLEKVEASPFLTGEGERGWKADLDFLLQEKSFNRIIEGYYDERKSNYVRPLSRSEKFDAAAERALDILNAQGDDEEAPQLAIDGPRPASG